MTDPMRVFWVSDNFNTPTGYGMQTFYLCNALGAMKDIEMGLLGWQHLGNILKTENFTLYPSDPQAHIFGATMFPHHIRDFKPDIVVSLADWWMTLYIGNARRDTPWRWMHWLPVDGYPFAGSKWNDQFNMADDIVMMSHFGMDQMRDGIEDAKTKKKRNVTFHLDYIPLCVDTDIFRPPTYEEKMDARKEFEIPEDAFVIGSVGRNQIRKDFPTLLEASKDLYDWLGPKRRDKVKIFLHTVPNDQAGWGLEWMRAALDLQDFVMFDKQMPLPNLGLPPKEMAKVYWAMDVHILPTRGEGFGVPIIEAMSCGLPNIITDVSTTPELLGARAEMACDPLVGFAVQPFGWYTMKGGVKRVIVDRKSTFEAMKFTYEHPEVLKEIAPLARQRAKKFFNIKRVVNMWKNLLDLRFSEWHDQPLDDITKRVRQAVGAERYDDDYMKVREIDTQSWYNKLELEVIKKHGIGDKWLEVGCGSGESMIMLMRASDSVVITGVDVSPASLRMCRGKGLHVYPMKAEKLEYPDESFDTVYSQHLVEHCRSDFKVVMESLRVAKYVAMHSLPYKNMRDPTHRREYDEKRVERLIRRVVKESPCELEAEYDDSVMPTSLMMIFKKVK